ncbi:hypothetical protein QN239_07935 [Mycolicibacterium sp. Y3]
MPSTRMDLKALFAPQPVNLLLVDLTAFVVAQCRPGTPEPMARVFGAYARSQALISASGSVEVCANGNRR